LSTKNVLIAVLSSHFREKEEDEAVEMDTESRDEVDFKLWVEQYTPRAYSDLLSDEVSLSYQQCFQGQICV
jgi:hypothetical protein